MKNKLVIEDYLDYILSAVCRSEEEFNFDCDSCEFNSHCDKSDDKKTLKKWLLSNSHCDKNFETEDEFSKRLKLIINTRVEHGHVDLKLEDGTVFYHDDHGAFRVIYPSPNNTVPKSTLGYQPYMGDPMQCLSYLDCLQCHKCISNEWKKIICSTLPRGGDA